jgi:SAM-dependent methyltransferase
MYEFIKSFIKKIVPNRLMILLEPLFRMFFYLFYMGSKNQCNICNKKLKKFVLLKNDELLCPFCGSIGRNRRLWTLLCTELKEDAKVLDFSPSRCLYRLMKRDGRLKYISSDYSGEFLSDVKYDITQIDSIADQFDVILCYHILEHIENDLKAMQELYRVLKPYGKIYIQTPFKAGSIYEDHTVNIPSERKRLFGQEDHVRTYSVEGLVERLKFAGLQVEILKYADTPDNVFGLKSNEIILVASKIE